MGLYLREVVSLREAFIIRDASAKGALQNLIFNVLSLTPFMTSIGNY